MGRGHGAEVHRLPPPSICYPPAPAPTVPGPHHSHAVHQAWCQLRVRLKGGKRISRGEAIGRPVSLDHQVTVGLGNTPPP